VNVRPDITVEAPCPGWRDALADCDGLCRDAALAAVAAGHPEDCPADIEIGIRLTDDAEMRSLNARYRGLDEATNVLAFPMTFCALGAPRPPGPPLALGDVVLAFETVRGETAAQGKSLADHLSHLVVHGTLHLLGYDHHDEAEALTMEDLETGILAGLGVADPYQADHKQRRAR